jgi:predicted Ser/Thr protein kinase
MTSSEPPDPAHHQRSKELFLEALEVPPAGRVAFVESHTAGDEGLRREVLQLLLLHGEDDSLLDAPADADDPWPWTAAAGLEVGPYRLLRPLGRGGMGVVYLAEPVAGGVPVALKLLGAGFLSPSARERFRREAEILRRLDHPGIARVLASGESDEGAVPQPWIAMEYVQGQPLLAFANAHALTLRARIELLAAICDAVASSHALGIVHRDLKPDNILVREDGRPVVLDFGVAHLVDDGARVSQRMTRTGVLVGTPQYMSPEQVQAAPASVTAASDVYALGVIAFELLAGQVPYPAGTTSLHRAVVAVLTTEPPPLGTLVSELKGPIERVVAKALEKRPRDRFPDAAAMADDLRRWLAGRAVRARGPQAWQRVARWSRRRRLLAGAIAAGLLAAAFVTTWWMSGGSLSAGRVREVYRASETDLFLACELIYRGERTPARLREGIALLVRARERLRGMPRRSHRERLEHSLGLTLGTAEMVLGDMEWDPDSYRAAIIHLNEALRHRPESGEWRRDVQAPEAVGILAALSRDATLSLLADAHSGLADLWGDAGSYQSAVRCGLEALAETRRNAGPPAPADSLGEPRNHNEPYVLRYNDLVDFYTRMATFRGDSALAARAVAYADSTLARRAAFRLNWPALGSVFYQRGRAWLALAEYVPSPAPLDSARRNFARSLPYRGPDRPRVFAETHEALAEASLLAARHAQAPAVPASALHGALAQLDTARLALPAGTRPELLARLRSLRVEALIELARTTRDRAWLTQAAVALDTNSRVFTFSDQPRYFAMDQVRRATLERVQGTIAGDTSSFGRARAALGRAQDQSMRGDSLVERRIQRERAALVSAATHARRR